MMKPFIWTTHLPHHLRQPKMYYKQLNAPDSSWCIYMLHFNEYTARAQMGQKPHSQALRRTSSQELNTQRANWENQQPPQYHSIPWLTVQAIKNTSKQVYRGTSDQWLCANSSQQESVEPSPWHTGSSKYEPISLGNNQQKQENNE